jgi:hypothetical protein
LRFDHFCQTLIPGQIWELILFFLDKVLRPRSLNKGPLGPIKFGQMFLKFGSGSGIG